MMVFYLTVAGGAACVCKETVEHDNHAPSCGCTAPVDTHHCADSCPCPVCCEIDQATDEFSVPPTVFTARPAPVSSDTALTANTHFAMPEISGIRAGPGDATPSLSGSTGLYRHICVYRL